MNSRLNKKISNFDDNLRDYISSMHNSIYKSSSSYLVCDRSLVAVGFNYKTSFGFTLINPEIVKYEGDIKNPKLIVVYINNSYGGSTKKTFKGKDAEIVSKIMFKMYNGHIPFHKKQNREQK